MRSIYRGHIVNAALHALRCVQLANKIYLRPENVTSFISDYQARGSYFLEAQGLVEHVASTADIYYNALVKKNTISKDKSASVLLVIGQRCATASKCLSGVMKSDRGTAKEFERRHPDAVAAYLGRQGKSRR